MVLLQCARIFFRLPLSWCWRDARKKRFFFIGFRKWFQQWLLVTNCALRTVSSYSLWIKRYFYQLFHFEFDDCVSGWCAESDKYFNLVKFLLIYKMRFTSNEVSCRHNSWHFGLLFFHSFSVFLFAFSVADSSSSWNHFIEFPAV